MRLCFNFMHLLFYHHITLPKRTSSSSAHHTLRLRGGSCPGGSVPDTALLRSRRRSAPEHRLDTGWSGNLGGSGNNHVPRGSSWKCANHRGRGGLTCGQLHLPRPQFGGPSAVHHAAERLRLGILRDWVARVVSLWPITNLASLHDRLSLLLS